MRTLLAWLAVVCLPAVSHAENWTFETDDYPGLERRTGLVEPPRWRQGATFLRPAPTRLPRQFDWRSEVSNASPIRNQGSCGSCWAFSTIAVFEWLFAIKEKKLKDLSEQHPVSCEKTYSYGCSGGWWHGAYRLLANYGAVYEEDFPYKAADVACKSVPYNEKLIQWAYLGASSGSTSIPGTPSVEDIKNAIYQYGPLGSGVAASGSFSSYKSGIFNNCTSSTMNHAVNIVGWNDDEGYWIMQNSWGQGWGENGYMRIKYNCNRIGYATSFAVYKPSCQPQPIPETGPDRTIDPGASVQLGTSPVSGMTYLWRPAAGLSDPTAANPMASPQMPTLYTLEVKSACGSGTKDVWVRFN